MRNDCVFFLLNPRAQRAMTANGGEPGWSDANGPAARKRGTRWKCARGPSLSPSHKQQRLTQPETRVVLTAHCSIPDLLTAVHLTRGKCLPFWWWKLTRKLVSKVQVVEKFQRPVVFLLAFLISSSNKCWAPPCGRRPSRFRFYKSDCGRISHREKDFPVPRAHFLQTFICLCAPFSESKVQASDGGTGPV